MTPNVRFFIDPDTGLPHVSQHGVAEDEVREVMRSPIEDYAGRDGSRIALGRSAAGRYLQIVYVPEPDAVFIVTASPMGPKSLRALRRRRRKKQ